MKPEPVLHTAPPLGEAVSQVVEQAPSGPVGLVGRPGLAGRLERVGRVVELFDESSGRSVRPFDGLAALVVVGMTKSFPAGGLRETMVSWLSTIQPGGLLVTAEMGAEGRVGSWLLGLGRRFRGRAALPPWALTSLLLELGVAPVRQVWPQGVGSWVLTWGPVTALASAKRAFAASKGIS